VLETTHGIELPPILADARLVKHIVTRLVAKACNAMPAGGVIRIRTGIVGAGIACARRKRQTGAREFVCLAISGTGVGVAATDPNQPCPICFGGMDNGGSKGFSLASVCGAVSQLSGWVGSGATARGGSEVRVFFPCAERSRLQQTLPQRESARNARP